MVLSPRRLQYTVHFDRGKQRKAGEEKIQSGEGEEKEEEKVRNKMTER